jgi:hypothetical protein
MGDFAHNPVICLVLAARFGTSSAQAATSGFLRCAALSLLI